MKAQFGPRTVTIMCLKGNDIGRGNRGLVKYCTIQTHLKQVMDQGWRRLTLH